MSPNAARRRVTLRITLPRPGPVRLVFYDVAGREARPLIDAELPAGQHEVAWEGFGKDGRRCSSGLYFCRLGANDRTINKRMIYLGR